MIKMKDIIKEGHDDLRKVAEPVKIPVSPEDKKILLDLLGYVINSQDEEMSKKYGLRPAVGLAAPQIDSLKRMFAIVAYNEEGRCHILPLVNPKIISHSKEVIYLPDGEGCISVTRTTQGVTPRYKEITFEAHKYNHNKDEFEKVRMTLKGYLAIVFQHEYDHLDGILYVDKLYNSLPNATPLVIESQEE